MRQILKIFLLLSILSIGCKKMPIIVNPGEEKDEKIKTEVNVFYLGDEPYPVIEFLNSEQTGLLISRAQKYMGWMILSYYRYVDESRNIRDTTIAYAVFRDKRFPISVVWAGKYREFRGIDVGDVYVDDFKLVKARRRLRRLVMMPIHPPIPPDTASYGVEYRMKSDDFKFKHRSTHTWMIKWKGGGQVSLKVETPEKPDIGFLRYNRDKNVIEFGIRSKLDSIFILLNASVERDKMLMMKPVLLIRVRNPGDVVRIEPKILRMIPPHMRARKITLTIVQFKSRIFRIPGYKDKVLGYVSSTLSFKIKLR